MNRQEPEMNLSQEWMDGKYSKEIAGKKAAKNVYTLRVSAPLVRVLRLVDSKRKPAMGYIYEGMDRTKKAIAASFNRDMTKYKDIFEIIDKRWECQLHHPLHATGYFFNLEFFYANPEEAQCEEVTQGLCDVIRKVARDINDGSMIVSLYKAMDRTKKAIAASFNRDMTKYKDIFEIIDKRWECQLHHPLHATGYFFNLEFFYANPEEAQCEEVTHGLCDVIRKLARDINDGSMIFSLYKAMD
ncbi:LOW QUALITY PROTEIN: hypothetical protein V2J09_021709 [Rumex salicifolius]